jgi:hypothetical protein
MKRRTILRVGAATAVLLGVAGTGVGLYRQAVTTEGRLTQPGRDLFASVAAAVLDGLLPTEPGARRLALDGHLRRLEATIAGFPPAIRAEIVELATLLAHPAGRLALAGLATDWAAATTADVQAALQSLRESRLALRQQVYHALRDLTNGAYFADPATWAAVGYPGPREAGAGASQGAQA